MYTILRGTFGSGKTTIMMGLFELMRTKGGQETIIKKPNNVGKEKHWAHVFAEVEGLKKPVVFMGKYGANQCGGADTLNWKGVHDQIEEFIIQHADVFHIFMEGSICSNTRRYDRVGVKLRERGIRSWFGHLATPREECIRRVSVRRATKSAEDGKDRGPLDPENLNNLYAGVEKGWLYCQ